MNEKNNKDKSKIDEIQRKLEKLAKLQMMLKDPRISAEDIDEEELDALLTKAEIMEEALKNYMYQFGMSLYQNKKGDNYFKKFIFDEDVRGYSELDSHNFRINDKEPTFLEKIFEYTPEEKVDLRGSIEKAVIDLYERDASMVDIFDEVIQEEVDRTNIILEDIQAFRNSKEAGGKSLEEAVKFRDIEEKSQDVVKEPQKEEFDQPIGLEANDAEDVRVIGIEEMVDVELLPDIVEDEFIDENDQLDDYIDDEAWQEAYESGSEMGKSSRVKLPKVHKVRRIRRPEPINVHPKDNIKDR